MPTQRRKLVVICLFLVVGAELIDCSLALSVLKSTALTVHTTIILMYETPFKSFTA